MHDTWRASDIGIGRRRTHVHEDMGLWRLHWTNRGCWMGSGAPMERDRARWRVIELDDAALHDKAIPRTAKDDVAVGQHFIKHSRSGDEARVW